MNLNDYRVHHSPYADAFELVYQPTGEILLYTTTAGLDTLMRTALMHDLKRRRS